MANKRISELNPATPLQDTDLLAVVQDTGSENETRKTTVGALRSLATTIVRADITSNDGTITVYNTPGTNRVDIGREFYVKSGAIRNDGRPTNDCYRIARINPFLNRFILLFEFYVAESPQIQTVNGSCIIDFNGGDCNFLYSTYASKSNAGVNPMFSPLESLFLVRTDTNFELWLKTKHPATHFMYGIKYYHNVNILNIVLESATNGYHTDIDSISGTKIYPTLSSQNSNLVPSNSSGFVENFPLSMSEGGQSISVGFYGVRFTPGQNFVAQYAQVCKKDNMTSGSFIVALYSAGITASSSSRTEGMELLAQSNVVSFSGSNGIAIAEFPEEEQILLEANKEYYMVLYVQHPSNSTRGLICRRLFSNDWGNSSLTLAFRGSSQTVLSTLGNSDFSTLYPSSSVNAIVLPYMKIYGQGENSNTNVDNSRVLEINDSNVANYVINNWLVIPTNVDKVLFGTTMDYRSIMGIKPISGTDFTNGKKLSILGNIAFRNSGVTGSGGLITWNEYAMSPYYYTYKYGVPTTGAFIDILRGGFEEFIFWNKNWWSKGY